MGRNGIQHIGAAALLLAVCVLIFGAVRYNLSAASAAMASMPLTVVIDAGHGGEDGGATGITGASESRLNLEIALRLEQLAAFCGLQTCMVRTTDTAIYSEGCETYSEKKISDLKNRVELINQSRPAVLVSIHQNHFPQEKYAGAMVFYAKSDGSRERGNLMQAQLNTAVQEKENEAAEKNSALLAYGGDIEVTKVLIKAYSEKASGSAAQAKETVSALDAGNMTDAQRYVYNTIIGG